MIRYVLAVILAAALLGTSMVALEHAATLRGEREVESAVTTVEEAAVSLTENDELPPAGQAAPRRRVEVSLPRDEFATSPVEHLTFERVPGENVTKVTYRVQGSSETTTFVDAPLVHAERGPLDLSGYSSVVLELELVPDSEGRPVVAVTLDPP